MERRGLRGRPVFDSTGQELGTVARIEGTRFSLRRRGWQGWLMRTTWLPISAIAGRYLHGLRLSIPAEEVLVRTGELPAGMRSGPAVKRRFAHANVPAAPPIVTTKEFDAYKHEKSVPRP